MSKTKPFKKTHWMSKTRFYNKRESMIDRCFNKKSSNYSIYWEKWILVCNEWRKFENFRDDMYDDYIKHVDMYWEKQTTLDRFPDKKWNYCPGNCRRATLSQQSSNRKFKNEKYIKIAKENNISYDMFMWRIKRWLSIDDAINNKKYYHKSYSSKEIEYNWKYYDIHELSNLLWICENTIRSRIFRKIPLDKKLWNMGWKR
jgi:hypothetical protein